MALPGPAKAKDTHQAQIRTQKVEQCYGNFNPN